DANPGAYLYYGVNTELSRDEFEAKINDNTLLDVLNRVEVKKGDVFFIEAGTIHAIGKGIVICEIQQNSNTTYRVYDYDRRDSSGKTRDLHVRQAIDVSRLIPSTNSDTSGEVQVHEGFCENLLASCNYFTVQKFS
ncbi:MAG: class I mannose-6-phosphate isomerase, partial [Oscillospiraceae bacterium]